jgi:hypothetical protein
MLDDMSKVSSSNQISAEMVAAESTLGVLLVMALKESKSDRGGFRIKRRRAGKPPTATISQAMQGKIPGVNFTRSFWF